MISERGEDFQTLHSKIQIPHSGVKSNLCQNDNMSLHLCSLRSPSNIFNHFSHITKGSYEDAPLDTS